MQIRDASPADAAEIAAVHVEGWRWAYRGHMPDALLDGLSVESRRDLWDTLLGPHPPEHDVSVAVLEDEIVGFIGTGPTEDASLPSGTAEVFTLYQRERVRGTGVGGALMRATLDQWRERGVPLAVLWVLASNTNTHSFYEHFGWHADGETREFALGPHGGRTILRYRIEPS